MLKGEVEIRRVKMLYIIGFLLMIISTCYPVGYIYSLNAFRILFFTGTLCLLIAGIQTKKS
ncbi:hypothetical protein CJ485_23090 [Priestia filamentosa]|nr:hypothetical protein CJ485_23090 [Priestia filamentosa]